MSLVVDAHTPNRSYPLPNFANTFDIDVVRLITALAAIDTDVANALAAITGFAPVDSPHLTGVPTAPTVAQGDQTAKIATTAFVAQALGTINLSGTAPIASPSFTGSPTAPTPVTTDNTGRLATTAFVQQILAAYYNKTQIDTQIAALTAAISSSGSVGAITYVPGTAAPTGFVKANGALLSRTTYANLWAYAQASGNIVSEATWAATNSGSFSVGDGSTTFRIPDLRGVFIRGFDDTRGLDASRGIGTYQSSQNLSHSHTASSDSQGSHAHSGTTDTQGNHAHGVSDPGHGHGVSDPGHSHGVPGKNNPTGGSSGSLGRANANADNNLATVAAATGIAIAGAFTGIAIAAAGNHAHNVSTSAAGTHNHNITVNADGGSEARPINVALLACIKY